MGILDALIDETGEGWEYDRAAQIDAVRARLAHPPKAREAGEGGAAVWVKGPLKIGENVEDVLRLDPWFRSRLRYNEFSGVVEWAGDLLRDEDVTAIRMAMARTYQLRASMALTHEIVVFTARKLAYHPVRRWLDGIRLSRRFMISCVARVMQPGSKVDTVLILAGPQGYGKSTFFRALAGPEYFRDSAIDLRNKDAYMALRGAWIYEMAEMAAMRPRDAETVKAFLSAQVDHYRPPYGRNQVEQPRQCVFVGMTRPGRGGSGLPRCGPCRGSPRSSATVTSSGRRPSRRSRQTSDGGWRSTRTRPWPMPMSSIDTRTHGRQRSSGG